MVQANHFVLNPNDMSEFIYKFTIVFRKLGDGPQRDIVGRVKRRVLELLLNMPGFDRGVYTDYEQGLWSFAPLTDSPTASRRITVDYYESEEQGPRTGPRQVLYGLTITAAAQPLPTDPLKALLLDASPRTVISRPLQEYEDALNVIKLRHAGQHPQLSTQARGTKVFPLTLTHPNVANTPSKRQDLGGGLSAYRGYARRARVLQGGTHLVLNATAGVMYNEGPADTLIDIWRQAHRGEPHDSLNTFMRRLRVQGKFGPQRVKPVHSVHTQLASQVTFRCENHPRTGQPINGNVSVAWYFKETYNLDVEKSAVLNVGDTARTIYWPATMCSVLPGQSHRHLLPLQQQAQHMIRFACRTPRENHSLITTEGMAMIGANRQGDSNVGRLSGTPLQLKLEMLSVQARRIPSPTIVFGNGMLKGTDTARGQWNLQGRRFKARPDQSRMKYTVIVLKEMTEPDIANLGGFVRELETGISLYCGVQLPATRVPNVATSVNWPGNQNNPTGMLKKLFNHCLGHGVQYCFVIPSKQTYYRYIKEAGDSVGMQTTVTLRKKDHTVKASAGEVANLMLKYSMKCGGTNWQLLGLDFEKILGSKETMLLGLDCVHPPPGAMNGAPSAAGMVYSTSPSPSQFLPIVQLLIPQKGKMAQEIVPNLHVMVKAALERWKLENKGKLPQQIFMCRDGVSDIQLQHILDQELPGIKKGVLQVYTKDEPQPAIFILNTQKRHITRLFRAKDDKSGAFDQKDNPLPGLMVDQKIVSRERDDWYAVSHKCLQGTSRPAHHIRCWDEIKLSKDALQQLVHNLSFIFPRSVTSVSIPTPAKLADLLVERAKVRLHEVYFPDQAHQNASYDPNIHFNGQNSIKSAIRDTMYYI